MRLLVASMVEIGMQAKMFPNAYGSDCNSGSSKPYGLPDFGSLKEDALLPQRCQDPTTMQVRFISTFLSDTKSLENGLFGFFQKYQKPTAMQFNLLLKASGFDTMSILSCLQRTARLLHDAPC